MSRTPMHPTHGRRSVKRSGWLRGRTSPEVEDLAKAAAAAQGLTMCRWLEKLVLEAAPPLLGLSPSDVPPPPKARPVRRGSPQPQGGEELPMAG
ncbi:hypothetical protein [Parafrankia sp. FMc2]|uniref:hypothetical protein n=1 Tax=Parafrankia sp. FMc2 TaxID=3233196 RepID=UPI0034D75D21